MVKIEIVKGGAYVFLVIVKVRLRQRFQGRHSCSFFAFDSRSSLNPQAQTKTNNLVSRDRPRREKQQSTGRFHSLVTSQSGGTINLRGSRPSLPILSYLVASSEIDLMHLNSIRHFCHSDIYLDRYPHGLANY